MSDLEVIHKGEEILKLMEKNSKVSLFSKDFWYGSLMDWSMKNPHFKTQLFRFVDVLPTLQSGQEVSRHLKEYFAESSGNLPSVFQVGLGLGSLAPSLMAGVIKKNIVQMAKLFITGEDTREALPTLKKMREQNMGFTVDVLGEATLSEQEAEAYQKIYLKLIEELAEAASSWKTNSQLDQDSFGAIPKVNVSVKLTALSSKINVLAWEQSKETLKEKLRPLFQKAVENFVFLNLDMEHFAVKDLTLEVFQELLLEPAFRNYRHFGCVIQAYLRDSFVDIEDLVSFARTRETPFTVRLVKGAYWDTETIEARERGWPVPVYTNKQSTDANYERCAELLLKNYPHIFVAFGSHNVRSLSYAMVTAEKLKVPQTGFEIQMLYGMAEPIKKTLAKQGFRVREYAPVGDLIPGMAYLVRRLLENTSNESWLRGKFSDDLSSTKLLQTPILQPESEQKRHSFENEPLLDFTLKKNRDGILSALSLLRKQLPQKVSPIVDGKTVETGQIIIRENPSAFAEKICDIGCATSTEVDAAIEKCQTGKKSWLQKSFWERSQCALKLADLMRKNKNHLIATEVLEVGKPWAEADGDIAEAIDFCEFYAANALQFDQPTQMGHAPGESSKLIYQARGITAVIAPWNFPLAILAGMTVASLVAGNPTIMKPAEQSSLIAFELMKLLLEAGFPADIIHFLPGLGEDVGRALVDHRGISNIVFTGSKDVGLQILKQAAIVHPGQRDIKRTILELGGKNALIIDEDADLDEAVDGVLYSAFGFAGQKCSACSRVIVISAVYDKFKTRLAEAAKSYVVSAAMEAGCDIGPVVDKDAQERILETIARAKQDFSLLFEGSCPAGGFFVPPAIFADVPASAWLAQLEIFGPVVAVIRAEDFTDALKIANDSQYALTGGIFSRSPDHIEKASREFEVGNLYINRGITGAMVDRHPFGGLKMSGVGSKTGGPDYLKQFLEPRVISENTLRRGFAPE